MTILTDFPPLTRAEARKVLADLADTVESDRRLPEHRQVWTDNVLAQVLPPLCDPELPPFVLVTLFLLLAEERADMQRADADYREVDIAESNVEHYLSSLAGAS